VTESEYRQLETAIESYKSQKQRSHYNLVGTVFCILRIYIPFKRKEDYFCSEFVSEQLKKMDSFKLKKEARMYHPTNLAKVLCRQPNLYRVLVNEV
jgi:hypothetical protein